MMALKRSLSIKRKLYWEKVSNKTKETNKVQQSLVDDIEIVRREVQELISHIEELLT